MQNICYKCVDQESLIIKTYGDDYCAWNDDLLLKTVYVILLYGSNGGAHILDYSRTRSKRDFWSMMGAEMYAFDDAFEKALIIRKNLEKWYDANFRCICTPPRINYVILLLKDSSE